MAHSSLRTRILVMTALPAFLAALVIGGYTLVHRMVEVRADTAHRQQLIIESYAARLAALGEAEQPAYEPLLRALLEEPDVRAASLLDNQSGWQSHAGPRLRPVQEAERLEGGGRRLVTDSSWQLVRALPGQRNRLLTVEFSRQGQYIEILEAVLTMIAVVVVLVLLAVMPAVRFAKRLTQPVDSLLDTVRRGAPRASSRSWRTRSAIWWRPWTRPRPSCSRTWTRPPRTCARPWKPSRFRTSSWTWRARRRSRPARSSRSSWPI